MSFALVKFSRGGYSPPCPPPIPYDYDWIRLVYSFYSLYLDSKQEIRIWASDQGWIQGGCILPPPPPPPPPPSTGPNII